jgi:threonine/homoserine/homoserine lactone efflux protein
LYLQEFIIIAGIHLLAVASPGPDFAIVLKQSIKYGRQTAIYTSLGIGCAILLHVAYSLVGIGLIIASNEYLFSLLKYIAAAYFCYIAWHGLRAKKPVLSDVIVNDDDMAASVNNVEDGLITTPSKRKAFATGFLINGLNVKATLFFVSLFSMVISPETPFTIKLGYGIYMAIATACWFSLLSHWLSHTRIRNALLSKGYWVDRVMGAVLLLLAIQLVFSEMSI